MKARRKNYSQGNSARIIEQLENRRLLATFVVTSNADPIALMATTLRQAIMSANLNPGPDTITFNIPGTPTIAPLTPLPAIAGPTTIDGTTQPGYAGTPLVFIDGTATIPVLVAKDGLVFTGGASTVKALAIAGFDSGGSAGIRLQGSGGHVIQNSYIGTAPSGDSASLQAPNFDGISVESAGNTITGNLIANNFDIAVPISADGTTISGNRIGTDASGAAAYPNGDAIVSTGASNTQIGGTTTAARNIISGNTNDAIRFTGAGSGNVVAGNYIGLNETGDVAIPNLGRGVAVEAATTPETTNLLVGGTSSGARNVISGNDGSGVQIFDVSGVRVLGNYIGADATGADPIGNAGDGVFLLGESGSTTIDNNLIAGNQGNGVNLADTSAGNLLTSNFIGVNAAGASTLGNVGSGVYIDSADNQIGTPAAGNSIAYNGGNGVTVALSDADIGNAIRGDNIFFNGGLGIDLGDDGVTPNDLQDPDAGPNKFQNYPVLRSVSLSGSNATISGTLNSTPSSTFIIDFFASVIWDTTTFGEGQKYLGSTTVTTDVSGNASFSAGVGGVPSGFNYFAATATDSAGNTSEFSYDPTPGSAAPAAAPQSQATPAFHQRFNGEKRITIDDDQDA
jgi:hypothetical protein